jgi:ABC-2 type transport system ATP-binding protein
MTGVTSLTGGRVTRPSSPTGQENLELFGRLYRLSRSDARERARDLLERFELGGAAHRVTGGYSHGMGRRLSVILAALHEPAVLLLDEPFDGVDPLGVEATMDVIADARARGAAVLVSTHLRELAVQACDDAVVLRGGSAVAAVDAERMRGEEGAGAYRALLD